MFPLDKNVIQPYVSNKIVTERLLLAPLNFGDKDFILELVNTEGWLRFIGNRNVNSQANAKTFIKKTIDDPDTNYWVVRFKSNNEAIGIVTLIKRDYLECCDIGSAFLPLYTNNGYAYEATKAFLYHILYTGKHTRICSITNAENTSAIKLVNKLGLDFLKDIEVKNEKFQLYEASVDKVFITEITRLFFSVFTNKGNVQPDLDLLNSICIPEVLITHRYRLKADVLGLASFIDKKRRVLTDGTIQEFEEKETDEKTIISQGIAARFSSYEKKGIAYRQRFTMRGRKLFQFVKIFKSWKISSILWEDDEN